MSLSKKICIFGGTIISVLILGSLLFYRIYLYDPVMVEFGCKLESWDISIENGIIAVGKNYSMPEGINDEAFRAACEARIR